MAFERPTISKLVRRGKSDLSRLLPGADTNLRYSPEEVLAIVAAGMTHGCHGHLKWLSKQLIADLADDEFLIRIASIYGLEQVAATFATGSITISGTNTTICPDGTLWVRGDGVIFVQDGAATISGGSATPTVIAQVAGADGNSDAGVALTLSSPIVGISSDATVGGDALTEGVDLEDIDSLRERLLARLQDPPKGGGEGDYVAWAREVAGVTRAWEYGNQFGPGTVLVLFVVDDQAVTIIPDAPTIATVQAHVTAEAPITADVTVDAPNEYTMAMTIAITPDTADVRAAVIVQIAALLRREAEPGGTIYLSQLNEAISLATGETDHTLTVPAANVTPADDEIVVLGTITWV